MRTPVVAKYLEVPRERNISALKDEISSLKKALGIRSSQPDGREYVAQLYDVLPESSPQNSSSTNYYLAMEKCEGTLAQLLEGTLVIGKEKAPLPDPKQRIDICKMMVLALSFLHSVQICHLNLKVAFSLISDETLSVMLTFCFSFIAFECLIEVEHNHKKLECQAI